jgi:hypothetical protein
MCKVSTVYSLCQEYSYLATEQASRSRCRELPTLPLPDGVGRYRNDLVTSRSFEI